MSMSNKPKCPNCGNSLVEILIGMPSSDLFEAAERKEVYLAGCEAFDVNPDWHCYRCNRDYYDNLKTFEVGELGDTECEDVAKELFEYAKTLPNLTRISVYDLAVSILGKPYEYYSKNTGRHFVFKKAETEFNEDSLFEIDAIFNELAESKDSPISLDFSEFAGQDVGLPFNIPFVIRKKH